MTRRLLDPATRLLALRQAMELSQRELAKEFRVSPGAIASWEIGSREIPGPVIKLIEVYENSAEITHEAADTALRDLKQEASTFLNKDKQKKIEKGLEVFFKDISLLNTIQIKTKHALIRQLIRYLSNCKGYSIKAVQLASYLEIGLPTEVRLAIGELQNILKPLPKKNDCIYSGINLWM